MRRVASRRGSAPPPRPRGGRGEQGRGERRAARRGPGEAGRVTVRLSKVSRAKAAKLRTLKLTVTVTPAGGSPATVVKAVRVR